MSSFNFDVFNSFQDGILIIDRNRSVVFANRTIRELYDCEDGPFRIKCHELSHNRPVPCDSPDFVCPHKKVFSTGQSINVTHTHVFPTGRKIVFEITCSPIRDKNGEVILMAEIMRDVTEMKRAEESLRSRDEKLKANEDFLTAVLNGIGDAVLVVDKDYRIISANEGYLRQTKLTLSEIKGRHCHAVSHHSDKPCYDVGEESIRRPAASRGATRTRRASFRRSGRPRRRA